VNQFKAPADKKGCTISQLALAWLLRQDEGIIPFPGTKRIKYLEENWGGLDVHLSDKEENEIRKFVDMAEVVGGRVPPNIDNSQAIVDPREQS
jgi:aryl-alcohol dehydrogenase-like predicted oxidoreductase